MKCPVDDETLLMTQRDGVEIDYCPKCRGVWLDRGELDKIIEKSIGAATPAVQLTPPPQAQPTAYAPRPSRNIRTAASRVMTTARAMMTGAAMTMTITTRASARSVTAS